MTFVDPQFELPEKRSATEALVRQIATDDDARFDRIERYNTIVIELARSTGAARTAETHVFAVADLLAPATRDSEAPSL